jgi:hypothetical protein
MKSKNAEEYIEKYAVGNSRDGAASMLKRRVIECVELAEQDAEDRERAKAYKIVKEMMGGIFQGDMPHKIANEFIQKMSDE